MSKRMRYAESAGRVIQWVDEIAANIADYDVGSPPRRATPAEKAVAYFASSISDGQGYAEFVEQEALPSGVFLAWVRNDERLNEVYTQSLKDRGVLRREQLLDAFWKTAKIDVPDTEATHADVHRAREALAKGEGLFKQGDASVKGSITVTFDDVDSRA